LKVEDVNATTLAPSETWTETDVRKLTHQAAAVSDIYAARFGIHRDAAWYLAKMTEEMGELQAAYLATQGAQRGKMASTEARQNLIDEAADLFGFLMVFADWQGIDLAEAFSTKWGRYLPDEGEAC
jgi:NTP pyrophosphatase (non-canonical NTP hydrolase)